MTKARLAEGDAFLVRTEGGSHFPSTLDWTSATHNESGFVFQCLPHDVGSLANGGWAAVFDGFARAAFRIFRIRECALDERKLEVDRDWPPDQIPVHIQRKMARDQQSDCMHAASISDDLIH